jgi:hypothetical protein
MYIDRRILCNNLIFTVCQGGYFICNARNVTNTKHVVIHGMQYDGLIDCELELMYRFTDDTNTRIVCITHEVQEFTVLQWGHEHVY